jgi:GTPase SAR1 family protein
MKPVFKRYGLGLDGLLTPLKWKPLVLVIGNYSSGKSTFINELLGRPVQRTGQAPTDDCFTILTVPDDDDPEDEVPGNTIVSDERLPFGSLRRFGESLISHLQMKRIDAPILGKLAIIDTPGMLDSVTEKDRGYDYLGVVGELAKLADLIILMFDPHKAGTIKETYQAIRSTLPGSTGEDRILYVLNRVDECDNVADLVRSYGTLCWNLSQMTGGKDMPRLFLTYAESETRSTDHHSLIADIEGTEVASPREPVCTVWISERDELKRAVESAPKVRLNHILQEVDRGIRELALQVEAFAAFNKGFRKYFQKVLRGGTLLALLTFFVGDLALSFAVGYPETPILKLFISGQLTPDNLVGPAISGLLIFVFTLIIIQHFQLPRFTKKTLADLDNLIPLETAYKRDLWVRVREKLQERISANAKNLLFKNHRWYLRKMEHFIDKDLGQFYKRVQDG